MNFSVIFFPRFKTYKKAIARAIPRCSTERILSPFLGYHTLADDSSGLSPFCLILAGVRLRAMTKVEVLSIFDRAGGFLTPDQVCAKLHPLPDRRSAYSYLLRLFRQGLLERNQAGRGRLAYRLTDRGRQRLEYLRRAG